LEKPAANETKQPKSGANLTAPETKGAAAETKPPVPEAPAKPANALEAELAAQLGEDWNKLPQKAKDRMIAAEMKSREADKRMQLAAKLKKDLDMTNAQVGQLIAALRQDPWKVLSNPALGHDVRKLAEEYVWQMIQEQRMTPEQREAMQAKMELQELKAQQEKAKKDQEQREMDALIAQRRQYWEKSISEAIDEAKLPKTSYTVRRFADYIRAAARSRQPADMPAIAAQIRQELVDLQSRFLLPPKREGETDDMYEERVLSSAPNDFIKLLRKADLKKLRASGKLPKPGPKSGTGPVAPQGQKKMSMSEWLNTRDQRLGRK
jgi:hypothetical protein